MARWYLTSCKESHEKSDKLCRNAELKSSGFKTDITYYLQAYHKRSVENCNIADCGNNDWISVAGTLIYKSRIGRKALKAFYQDFIDKGIQYVRKQSIGHYAVAIKSNNTITIFTDPNGELSLFYTDTGSSWFLSNSLQLCANSFSSLALDPIMLSIFVFKGASSGDNTFYPDIKRLFGTQVVDINLNEGKFRIESTPDLYPLSSPNYSSIVDAIQNYKSDVQSVFREIASVGSIGLLGTGGIDSRTALASLLDQNVEPEILYGTGNSNLTDDKIDDFKVAKVTAKKYNLPFRHMDWSGDQPHCDKTMSELFSRYGFQYEIYSGSQSVIETFNNGISPSVKLFLGGRFHGFISARPWDLPEKYFSFNDLIEYLLPNEVASVHLNCKDEFVDKFVKEVEVGLRRSCIEYPYSGVQLNKFVKAVQFLGHFGGARFLNFANEFVHYIDPFNTHRLYYPLLNIPLEFRKKDEFQVRLIHALIPDLLDIPLFTWGRFKSIDKNSFQVVPEVINRSFGKRVAVMLFPNSVRLILSKVYQGLHPNRILKKDYKSVGEFNRRKERNQRIIRTYSKSVMNDRLIMKYLSSTSDLQIKILSRYYHYLYGVNSLGYNIID